MARFSIVELASAPTAAEGRRLLRCPSCCARLDLGGFVAEDWRELHRCGDHVIEATARMPGAPGAWRWRSLER
jgi:hypothetical protein